MSSRCAADCSSPLGSSVEGLALDGECDGIAAAKAERGDTALQIAPLQFIKQRDQHARARCANRMTERDRATVHVYFSRIKLQDARYRDCRDRKCLVQFVQIHILVAIPADFRE